MVVCATFPQNIHVSHNFTCLIVVLELPAFRGFCMKNVSKSDGIKRGSGFFFGGGGVWSW